MILYFTGTGNSLAIARKMAERLDEPVSALCQAIEVGGRPTRKDRQYHNPDVGLKDMSNQAN